MIKNVVIVNDWAYKNGGAGNVAISTALGLSELGLNVYLFSAVGPASDEILNSNIKVICLGQYDILTNPSRQNAVVQGIWNRKAKQEMGKLLATMPSDETVVHLHGWIKALSPAIFKSLLNFSGKIFVTLHDYFLYCPNGGFYDYQKQEICKRRPLSVDCLFCNCDARSYFQKQWRVLRQIYQNSIISKLMDRITFLSISELTKSIFVEQFGGNYKLRSLQNMIDKPIEIELEQSHRDGYVFMARLSSEKGLDMFCEAMKKLDLKGVVLGDGPLYEEYRRLYPQIDFVGWANSEVKKKYLKKTKAFVFSSKWMEPFGLSVIEMLSLGIPCIVSDNAGVGNIVKEGVNGFMFESGSIDSLCESINKMENSNLINQVNDIKESVDLEEFSLSSHLNKLVELYNL